VEIDPPHDVLYQYQFAPVLKLPPFAVNVVDDPGHIADGLPVAEVAGVELTFTVSVTDVLLLIHCKTFHERVNCPLPAL
jgi:hypothetical protein